jgi:hypothetical protein
VYNASKEKVMTTDQCLAGMSWRVFQHGRFVGYVVSFSQDDAWRKAKDKYGSDLRIEKVVE